MIERNITNKRGIHSKRLFIFLSPTNKNTQLNINHALLAVEKYHREIYFITLQVGKRKHTTLYKYLVQCQVSRPITVPAFVRMWAETLFL